MTRNSSYRQFFFSGNQCLHLFIFYIDSPLVYEMPCQTFIWFAYSLTQTSQSKLKALQIPSRGMCWHYTYTYYSMTYNDTPFNTAVGVSHVWGIHLLPFNLRFIYGVPYRTLIITKALDKMFSCSLILPNIYKITIHSLTLCRRQHIHKQHTGMERFLFVCRTYLTSISTRMSGHWWRTLSWDVV